jgi:outer membrane receptor protein involved in Fe transport
MKNKLPALPACVLALLAFSDGGARLAAQAAGGTAPNASAKPSDEDVVRLNVFDVTESRDVGYISTNAESATRLNVPIGDIPQNIVVFNQEFLRDIMAESIADVVLYDPTITPTNEGDSFAMRGMGGAAAPGVGANYFNGFEQLGGFGSQTIVNTERIEILKGPNAVLYGQGAFGGTISRTSKKPTGAKKTSLVSRIDQYGFFRAQLDTQAPIIKKKLALRLNARWGKGDDFKHYPQSDWVVSPSLRWDITRRDTLFLEYTRTYEKVSYTNLEFLLHDGNPLEITVNDIRHPVDVHRYLGTQDDRNIHKNNIVYAEYRHEFSRNFHFRAMFNSENKSADNLQTLMDAQYFAFVHQPGPDGKPDINKPEAPYVSRYFRDWIQSYDAYRARVEFVLTDVDTWFVRHKLILGAGWEDLATDDIRLQSLHNRTTLGRIPADGAPYMPFETLFNDNLRLAPANILDHTPEHVPWVGGPLQPLVFDHYNADGIPVIAQHVPGDYGSTLPRVNVNQRMTTRMISYYFSDRMSLLDGRAFVQFGLRYLNAKRTEDRRGLVYNRFSAAENDRRLTDKYYRVYNEDPLTHSFGLVYHLTKNKQWTAYFNNNASFYPNYSTEYPEGPKLKSMTGTQYEAGVKFFDVKNNRFHATLSYFNITQRNVPQAGQVTYTDESGVVRDRWGTITIKGLNAQGAELGLNAMPLPGWQVVGGYAFIRSINLDPQMNPNTGERFDRHHYRTPRHSVSMRNTYKFTNGPVRGLTLGLGLQWRDTMLAQYIPYTNEIRAEPPYRVPSYLNIDADVAYGFKLGKKLFCVARLKVSNATGEYNALASYNIRVNWARPRNAVVELEMRF